MRAIWLLPVLLCGQSAHADGPSRQEQVIVESFRERLPENVRARMEVVARGNQIEQVLASIKFTRG